MYSQTTKKYENTCVHARSTSYNDWSQLCWRRYKLVVVVQKVHSLECDLNLLLNCLLCLVLDKVLDKVLDLVLDLVLDKVLCLVLDLVLDKLFV